MKKIAFAFVIIFLALTASHPSKAQSFRLGLTASPSLAWFKPEHDEYTSEGLRLGFSYGLLSEFILAEQYSFATGINITYFGGKLSYPVSDTTFQGTTYQSKERTYRLQNMEIPLTLKMKTREIGYNTYFAVFGFGGSVNLRSKGDDRYQPAAEGSRHTIEDIDIAGDIPLFRISMILGLGLEHSLGGTTALVGGITFNNGFTNILTGKDYQGNKDQQARANYLELSIGILF